MADKNAWEKPVVTVYPPAPGIPKPWEEDDDDPYPRVKGVCPACDTEHLFLGEGGYVTCSFKGCPQPDLVSDLLIEGCPDE